MTVHIPEVRVARARLGGLGNHPDRHTEAELAAARRELRLSNLVQELRRHDWYGLTSDERRAVLREVRHVA